MVSNKDLIKSVFNDNLLRRNDWFFKANWEKARITELESKTKMLEIGNIIWKDSTWKYGLWNNGTWYNGIWKSGYWYNGTWHNGTWKSGWWYDGIWKDGNWEDGYWCNGIWKSGEWKKGKIYNPKTREYIESTVPPNKCKWSLSYGK